MRTAKLLPLSVGVCVLLFSTVARAQLTWDPDGDQVSNGGDGTWSLGAANWDDNGSAPNVGWTNGGDAVFGKKADSSTSDVRLPGFSGVTVRNITLESPSGTGAVWLGQEDGLGGFDGDFLTVASGGGTWELGGRTLHIVNNDSLAGYSNDLALSIGSGDTLTVTDASGGGVFNTGERPTGAGWFASGATLDIQDGVTLRGQADSVGQFADVIMSDGSTYIYERNTPNQAHNNNWQLNGDVFFDNNFNERQFILAGVVSGAGTVNLVDMGIPETNNNGWVRLANPGNTFTGGVVVDSTNSRSELNIVTGGGDGAFGAVPGSFDADNITLRNGGELKMTGVTINANRGVTLDGGGIIVNNNSPNSYGGTISGTGGLQIGRQAGGDGNRLILTSNTHTYTGDTRIFQGSIQLGIDNAIPTDHVLTIGGKGGSRFYMEGFDQEIAGLQTAASNTRQVVNDGGSVSTLTINTAADTSHTYNGNFNGSSTVAIVKNGDGTQIFSKEGNGGFGTTPSSATANAGRLRFSNPVLDDDPNSAGTPTTLVTAVTVNSGATFVIDGGGDTPNDGNGWDQDEIDVLMAGATFNAGSILGINTGNGDFTYSSNLTGNQGLYKIQANTLNLTGTNTYLGPTFVENGTLLLDTPAALPNNGLSVEGTEGPGYVGFNYANWSEAQVNALINAGTTTFEPNAGVELAIDANSSYSQVIPGFVTNFAMRGAVGNEELTLTANNVYTGATTVRSGRLKKGTADSVPSGTLLTVGEGAADARFEMNGFDQTVSGLQSSTTGVAEFAANNFSVGTLTIDVADGESYDYNGRMGGTVGIFDNNYNVVKNGAGSQTFGGPNAYQGTTTVNAGLLVIEQPLDAAALNPGDVTVAAGAGVVLEGGGVSEWSDTQMQDFLANQNLAAGITFGIQTFTSGENFTFTGVISGDKNFEKRGGQSLTFTQAQTYTGDTLLENGTVELSVANTLPTGTVVSIGGPNLGVTVRMNGNDQQIAGLVAAGSGGGSRRWTNGSTTAATLSVNVGAGESYAYTHTLGIDGDADANNFSFTKSGDGSQSIANAFYTGATNVDAGTLLFNGNAASASGGVTVASGATVGGTGTVGGAVTAQSGGSVAPGASAGTLTLLSSLTVDAGASLDFELQGSDQTVGGGVNDLIDMSGATGSLTLNGTLNVSALADSAADFNGDGSVNDLDLSQWEGDFGVNGDSDADADGDSDLADLMFWQRDFGVTGNFDSVQEGDRWTLITYDDANVALSNALSIGSTPTLPGGLIYQIDDSVAGQIDLVIAAGTLSGLAAVPEPGSFVLLALGGAALLRRRRTA